MKLSYQPGNELKKLSEEDRLVLRRRWEEIARALNLNADILAGLLGSSAYTPTNVTPDRSYDANATTIDELADVLGTLIADLQAKGILS